MAEFDEILVGGARREAADVQVGFTELLHCTLAAAIGAGTGWSHWRRGRGIGLLFHQ